MGAVTMCEYTKQEFSTGMLKLGCDSVSKLKQKLPELRAELKSEDRFRCGRRTAHTSGVGAATEWPCSLCVWHF
eukprot:356907-Chlamydomonas_euryale.AAC.2